MSQLPVKPTAVVPGSVVRIVAPAGVVDERRLRRGCTELERLGYQPRWSPAVLARDGYFAGAADARLGDLRQALAEPDSQAIVAARGGYGTNYLLAGLESAPAVSPRAVVGFSDLTLVQSLLWQRRRWVTFYGPMVAAGLEGGAGQDAGYDLASFCLALTEARTGWKLPLAGEVLSPGEAEGVLLGGCLTLVEALLGTPWELETAGAILLLEDRMMRPYQIDRALMHLLQAGKLARVRGIVLGDFPDCDVGEPDTPAVREVCARVLAPLGVPVVYGAPVGHTYRPMLTLPLGVRARLVAAEPPELEILEPAVAP
jgi:muramoyltetrapeptide carboxypeptidase